MRINIVLCIIVAISFNYIGFAIAIESNKGYQFVSKWGTHADKRMEYPNALEIDKDNNIYVLEDWNRRLMILDAAGKLILAKYFQNSAGDYSTIYDLAIANNGNIYLTVTPDGLNIHNQVIKYNTQTDTITNLDIQGYSLAIDSANNIYVSNNGLIKKYDSQGQLLTSWDSGINSYPFSQIEIDNAGDILVTDNSNYRILKYNTSGTLLAQWGSKGTGQGQFETIFNLASDSANNIYVIDNFEGTPTWRVQKLTVNGAFVSEFICPDYLFSIYDLSIDASGNIYLANAENYGYLAKFNSKLEIITAYLGDIEEGKFASPQDICISIYDPPGMGPHAPVMFPSDLFIVDTDNHCVQVMTESGKFKGKWGSFGIQDGQFIAPSAIAADIDRSVYIVDRGNNRIQKFNSSGTFLAKWGSKGSSTGQFATPGGIAIDLSGNLYVADTGNHRVQKFDNNGRFITMWGSEGTGEGQFQSPIGIAVDLKGNVYVVGSTQSSIYKNLIKTVIS